MKTEKEKMLAGEAFKFGDAELMEDKKNAVFSFLKWQSYACLVARQNSGQLQNNKIWRYRKGWIP